MTVKYLQIESTSEMPDISALNPFRAVVIVEENVSLEWQIQISNWLVSSGCLYMMAWGLNCITWDDSVDIANLEQFNHGEIPDDKFVITTWHENEPLKEVFWFSKHSAIHPDVDIKNNLLLHISKQNNEKYLLDKYTKA